MNTNKRKSSTTRRTVLSEREGKFRTFVEESLEGFVLTDVQGIVVEWNRSMESITGIERKNAIGKYIWDLQSLLRTQERQSEELDEKTKSTLQEALKTGSSPIINNVIEIEIQKTTGQRIIVEQSAFTIKSERGYWLGTIIRDVSARKYAENALKESLLKLNALLNNIPDIAWMKDEESRYIAANKALAEMNLTTPEDIIGKTDFDLSPADQARGFRADDQDVMLTKKQKRIEELLTDKSGNTHWLETIKTPIFNLQGEVIGTTGIGRDITERKRIERLQAAIYRISEAAHNASTLDELYPSIHTLIQGLMPAKNFFIALYNPLTDLLSFPYHADELEPDAEWPPIKHGKGLSSYVFRSGKPLLATPELFEQLVNDREVELIGKKAIDWLGVPLNTQHTKVGVIAVQTYNPKERLSEADRDILSFVSTQVAMAIERKQVEDALHTIQMNLEDAQHVAHIGSWDWNLFTSEVTFSNEIYRILGMEPGSINSLDFLISLVHPEDQAWVQDIVVKSLKENKPFSLDHRFIRSDGGVLIIHSQSDVIYNDSGNPVRRIGTLQDITEVKLAEAEREKLIEELQSKNREMERFTYTVSHDLRAPLVTIKGFLGFMENDLKAGKTERVMKDMDRVTTAANKMQQFLDELLELSRAGRIMKPPESVPFQAIVMDTLEILRGQLNDRGVQIDIAENLPIVLCDRTRLTQVVQNLVDNAVKFIGDQPKPRVEIGVEGKDSEGKVILFIRDNGIGIDPRYQDEIFNIFSKLNPQTEGLGIGLALVKRIIEAHNGRIWLISKGNGKGSTFYFTCPSPGVDVRPNTLPQ